MENPFKNIFHHKKETEGVRYASSTPASMSLSPIEVPNDDTEYTTAEQVELANRLHDFGSKLRRDNPNVKIVYVPEHEQRDEKGHWHLPGSTR